MYVQMVANDVIAKTKISCIDGLPYFHNYGPPHACQSRPSDRVDYVIRKANSA